MGPPKANSNNLHSVVNKINNEYQGVTVAWTDNVRAVQNKTLSCIGKNITDQRLEAEDGQHLPLVRTQNLNETLGIVNANQINCGEAGTFMEVWEKMEAHIGYRYKGEIKRGPIKKVVMRFQEAFVPVEDGKTRNVAPSNFSYQTFDASNPCNLLVVVTPTGICAHTDGVGFQKLLAHTTAEDGSIKECWFKAEESEFAAGHVQVEVGTKPSGGDRSKTLGLLGSGERCNRMLIFSIPLEQKLSSETSFDDDAVIGGSLGDSDAPVFRSLGGSPPPSKCRAARLSLGSAVGDAIRHDMDLVVNMDQPVLCTQIDYNVLVAPHGGNEVTISEHDAKRVANSLTFQYGLCDAVCKLSELPVCLHQLEKKHTEHIQQTFEAVAKKAKTGEAACDPFTPNAEALSFV